MKKAKLIIKIVLGIIAMLGLYLLSGADFEHSSTEGVYDPYAWDNHFTSMETTTDTLNILEEIPVVFYIFAAIMLASIIFIIIYEFKDDCNIIEYIDLQSVEIIPFAAMILVGIIGNVIQIAMIGNGFIFGYGLFILLIFAAWYALSFFAGCFIEGFAEGWKEGSDKKE